MITHTQIKNVSFGNGSIMSNMITIFPDMGGPKCWSNVVDGVPINRPSAVFERNHIRHCPLLAVHCIHDFPHHFIYRETEVSVLLEDNDQAL